MARPKPCPLCGKPPTADHAPFCGQGCRDRDLMQWLSEGYAIPAATPIDEVDSPRLDGGLDGGLDSTKDGD